MVRQRQTIRAVHDWQRQRYLRALLVCIGSLDRTLVCSCFENLLVAVRHRKHVQCVKAKIQKSLHKSSVAMGTSLLALTWFAWQTAYQASTNWRYRQLQGRMQCFEAASCVLSFREKSTCCGLLRYFFCLWHCVGAHRLCREQKMQRCMVSSATVCRLSAANDRTLLHMTWSSWGQEVLQKLREVIEDTTRTAHKVHQQMHSHALMACGVSSDRTLRSRCFACWSTAVQHQINLQEAKVQEVV